MWIICADRTRYQSLLRPPRNRHFTSHGLRNFFWVRFIILTPSCVTPALAQLQSCSSGQRPHSQSVLWYAKGEFIPIAIYLLLWWHLGKLRVTVRDSTSASDTFIYQISKIFLPNDMSSSTSLFFSLFIRRFRLATEHRFRSFFLGGENSRSVLIPQFGGVYEFPHQSFHLN